MKVIIVIIIHVHEDAPRAQPANYEREGNRGKIQDVKQGRITPLLLNDFWSSRSMLYRTKLSPQISFITASRVLKQIT